MGGYPSSLIWGLPSFSCIFRCSNEGQVEDANALPMSHKDFIDRLHVFIAGVNSLMITTTTIFIFRSSLSLNGRTILFWRKESASPHPEGSKVRKKSKPPLPYRRLEFCLFHHVDAGGTWWNGLGLFWIWFLIFLIFFFLYSLYQQKEKPAIHLNLLLYYCDCFLKVYLM